MEGARLIHGIVGGLFAKNYHLPEFPWDDEGKQKPKPYTQEDIAQMQAEAQAWADRLNSQAPK